MFRNATKVVIAAMCCANTLMATAQDYPLRPIRMLAGPPGGSSDFAARLIVQGLTTALGQPVIMDNRSGAVQAIMLAARAPRDGYTLLFYGSSLWTGPLIDSFQYDPMRDFSPVTLAMLIPSVLMVHPSVPVNSVKELISLAKAKPGQINYGSGPSGSTSHVYAELFKSMTDTSLTRIPYGGGGPATRALIGGEVQVLFGTIVDAKSNIQAGRARGLGVTSAQRVPTLPDIPTIAASGAPGYEGVQRAGIFAPAGTPAAIVTRLQLEIARVLNKDDVRQRFANVDMQVLTSTPQEFARVIKDEMARLAPVLKKLGAQP